MEGDPQVVHSLARVRATSLARSFHQGSCSGGRDPPQTSVATARRAADRVRREPWEGSVAR